MSIKCANFMNPEGVRTTVKAYQEKWGHPEEPQTYDLTDENIARNCSMCDYGLPKLSAITQAVGLVAGDITAEFQQEVKRLTGEHLKRLCFKDAK